MSKTKFDHNWKWRKEEKLICKGCEKEFIRKSQNNLFCSINCGQNYRRKNNHERYINYDKKRYLKDKDKITKQHQKYRRENPEKLRTKERKSYWKNKKYYNGISKEWREKNPEKIKATTIANNKITIPQNQLCEICNEREATIKHHEDYTKPIEVKFVCASCHRTICHS